MFQEGTGPKYSLEQMNMACRVETPMDDIGMLS